MDFYSIAKKKYYDILVLLGKHQRLLSKLTNNFLVILNLHKVNPYPNPFYQSLHPKVFAQLISYLQKHFIITNFSNLNHTYQEKKPKVILSFDDGYYDFIEYVLPITTKFNIIPNQNIICSSILTGQPPWNIMLYDFLNQSTLRTIQTIKMHNFGHKLIKDTLRAKTKFGLQISTFLKNKSARERKDFWDPIHVQIKNSGVKLTRMITVNELLQIKNECELGAHSFTHESMGYETFQFFQNDFLQCSHFFNDYLQKKINIYAFPNGNYQPKFCNYLMAAGVQFILLVGEKFSQLQQNILPRITVYGSSFNEVRLISLGIKTK